MDRRCYSCATKFSIFKKECGCKNCGRCFCSGCVSHSAVVPRFGSAQKVCRKCFEDLTSGCSQKNNPAKWSPPENYKKRVAALEAKQNKPVIPQQRSVGEFSQRDDKYQGLSAADRAIAERLEKLKQETRPKSVPSQKEIERRLAALQADPVHPVPSDQDMEDRLAALQGRRPPSQNPRPAFQAADNRSQTEQADDLLKQLAEETALDQNYEAGAEAQGTDVCLNDLSRGLDSCEKLQGEDENERVRYIEDEKKKLLEEAAIELKEDNIRQEQLLNILKRLAVLKGEDPEKVTLDGYTLPDSDDENEEEAIQRILKQLSDEAFLDEASGFNIPPKSADQPKQSHSARRKVTSGVPPVAKTKDPTAPCPSGRAMKADSDDEELPWCCICNNDATLRCHGCDGDLYCQRCFREGHDKFDRQEHRTSSYRAPSKLK
ncbi:abscission/NoCut checkpoint regulator isoform X2 [Protopterus annectens]|uniref:abscission/NoCut checkpoint regulator isoform X2 n=1 Tax=Protopterus annectens TaxID=7888 RepID=UPI001CF9E13A|nr:abscission/NoCut checkpoint regulator isoform X2 [Protopterus annectens]